ncbi:uncharacterized protein OCT59_026133 [Rhizophagus irregularis]|uniref:Uncharacterized protein n=1 Tax=Rhizophagus irregularis (strain DAOM 181602 / DAOM 197198 / MUCL 43194) TaxID=747089 RepID=A0A2P4P7J0_RHIID|nr:hypothetical protein GLOIN_2v1847073 [Rhizophagus irregularis DAOM 181602=DAOM 197198]POG61355.1 hypothetical protein GLOIN_2v1847073 [Rhizophagus irregularis DAOM 181602=DAOM 197198]UZO05793.1 hypothetical protein OCT59_026133 [Rhizophagus irregularis]GET50416.1 hypothetical protein GLOIN_2v1847073 [Rhizophagus irregularis DAOM 181602=DAOM 197198]|eukprot:XP_025168221.1 hypothetical protein GLOIN_2v1847073 [Rhizophagus irregularis DAOM 181602=DAOM 197198]
MNRLERRILLIYPSDLDGFAGEMYIYEDPLKILADGAYHKNYEKNILGSGVIISQFIQNRYLLITEAGYPFGLIMIVDIVNKDVLDLTKDTIVSILLEEKFSEPSIILTLIFINIRISPIKITNDHANTWFFEPLWLGPLQTINRLTFLGRAFLRCL